MAVTIREVGLLASAPACERILGQREEVAELAPARCGFGPVGGKVEVLVVGPAGSGKPPLLTAPVTLRVKPGGIYGMNMEVVPIGPGSRTGESGSQAFDV